MSDTDYIKSKLATLKSTCGTLSEALSIAKTELEKDGAIKRFEYCYELAWKTMKLFLEFEGKETGNTPRAVIKEAFLARYINEEETWIEMIQDRNLIIHTYDQQKSELLFQGLKEYDTAFSELITNLENTIIKFER